MQDTPAAQGQQASTEIAPLLIYLIGRHPMIFRLDDASKQIVLLFLRACADAGRS